MGVNVVKDAIDLGIVTTNGDAMLTFYRDVLGFKHEGDIHMEHVGIQTMHRLWFGNSLIKIVVPVNDPNKPPAPDGIPGGTGYRYWTMTISKPGRRIGRRWRRRAQDCLAAPRGASRRRYRHGRRPRRQLGRVHPVRLIIATVSQRPPRMECRNAPESRFDDQ